MVIYPFTDGSFPYVNVWHKPIVVSKNQADKKLKEDFPSVEQPPSATL
jgi:hypothetical protein